MSYDPAALAAPSPATIRLIAAVADARPHIVTAQEIIGRQISDSPSQPLDQAVLAATQSAREGARLIAEAMKPGVDDRLLGMSRGVVSLTFRGTTTLGLGTDRESLRAAWNHFGDATRAADYTLRIATQMPGPDPRVPGGSTLGSPA